MTKIIFMLSLLPAFASAAPRTWSLHLEYSYGERASCMADLTVEAGEEYLACETKIDGKQAFLRVKVNPQPKHLALLSLRVERVEDSGQIQTLASPRVVTAEGQTAKLSEESEEHPESRTELSLVLTRN